MAESRALPANLLLALRQRRPVAQEQSARPISGSPRNVNSRSDQPSPFNLRLGGPISNSNQNERNNYENAHSLPKPIAHSSKLPARAHPKARAGHHVPTCAPFRVTGRGPQ